jgi:NADP-dependent 3-hydroxy acid dehydrogenase YdfG
MNTLDNTTAVISGASSGIGCAVAKALAHQGSQVFITGRDVRRLHEAADAIRATGGLVSSEAFDVRDSNRLQAFVANAAEETGRLNVMVNAAGLGYMGTIAEGKPAEWREMFDINVLATLVGSQAAIAAMRRTGSSGHIVTISSYTGRMEASHVYGATKAAVNSICATLRKELEDEPIRIVNIVPGAVATNFGRNFSPDFVNAVLTSFGLPAGFRTGDVLRDSTLKALNARAASLFASPDDIARAVLYAVTQPDNVNVSEIVIGPRKAFPLASAASSRKARHHLSEAPRPSRSR